MVLSHPIHPIWLPMRLPLGAAEQDRIAEETFNEMKSAPSAPSFGQDAVEQAAGEGALRNANSVSAPPAETDSHIRFVGARTFVRSDSAWVDTTFDPDRMQTVQIAFLSDDYFALVAADPQLGAAFALGPSVIALSNGIAYQVVAADSAVPALEISEPQDPQISAEPEPTGTPIPAADGNHTSHRVRFFHFGNQFPLCGQDSSFSALPSIWVLSFRNCKNRKYRA